MKMKKINPLEVVQDQYQHLKDKLLSTNDVREKNLLFKRLNNLANVMQFLMSIGKNTWLDGDGMSISPILRNLHDYLE